MFLNISRISASNVLEMFVNLIVSIGCAVVVVFFPFVQANRKHKYDFFELAAIKILNLKGFKQSCICTII